LLKEEARHHLRRRPRSGSFDRLFAVRQGFTPDSISTDLHTDSMNAGARTCSTMSKFLNLGMPLDDVACATWNPAREIRQRNSATPRRAVADIVVLWLVKGVSSSIPPGCE
jgi:dihydroorotase